MLLARHKTSPGLERDLSALTGDPAPLVRRAAVASLTRLNVAEGVKAATVLLADPVWYVRAHAARAVGAAEDPEYAHLVAPLLADREWWVRTAAKDALQRMGSEVWSSLVPFLDHADEFARNGAAEVLQNVGILDSLIVLEAATVRPSAGENRDAPQDHGSRWNAHGRGAAGPGGCGQPRAGARAAVDARARARGGRVMSVQTLATWFVTAAVAYLLASYALGGPVALVRALVAIASRRRARYRGHPDDVMASSRFTIPVSVILPIGAEQDVTGAVDHLLGLTYPEHEVIVVTSAPHGVPASMRERYDLKACEIFFRRSLRTPPVRALYRSGADARLLVVECDAHTRGDALNSGVNLARYRYVCCADHRARYAPDSLLKSMQPAVEDPAVVIAVTTMIAGSQSGPRRRRPGERVGHAAAPLRAARAARPRRA